MVKIACVIILMAFGINNIHSYQEDTYDFLMPNVWPNRDELYLCTPIRISPKENFYVVGFKPNATMHTAHHMLLYGCTEPGSNDVVWGCGEMQSNEVDDVYNSANPCKSGSQIVYAWARDAPSLKLPKDVGFLIGKDSPIKYLVLQVHYMKRFDEGKTDNSGVFLKYTRTVMPRQAGVILLGTSGAIPPHQVEHMETACDIQENKVIHPFAFRTHTHSLGLLVSGFVVRQQDNGDKWQLIGKKNPQLPQMFYPVTNYSPIGKGDILAARCTMNNSRDHVVKIGIDQSHEIDPPPFTRFLEVCGEGLCPAEGRYRATNKDEMCNFYLMYWVENDTPLQQKYCFSPGPPKYYWAGPPYYFSAIPDVEASTL